MSSRSRRTASALVSSVLAMSWISIFGNCRRISISAWLMICGPSRNGHTDPQPSADGLVVPAQRRFRSPQLDQDPFGVLE